MCVIVNVCSARNMYSFKIVNGSVGQLVKVLLTMLTMNAMQHLLTFHILYTIKFYIAFLALFSL
jgi:hypothetical protein